MTENPFVRGKAHMDLVAPRHTEGKFQVVVLDRVDGPLPEYAVRGQVECYNECGFWCWLGEQTYTVVHSGRAAGVCRQCAARVIPPGREPIAHVEDP